MNALLARYQDDLRRSHAELEASTRELKLSHFMIDHATDLVALQTADGVLVYANRAAQDCMGQDETLRSQLSQQLFSHAGQALPHTFETRLQCRQGHLHLEVTLTGLDYQGVICAPPHATSASVIMPPASNAWRPRCSNPAMKPF
jgi:PAS domain-containing protein